MQEEGEDDDYFNLLHDYANDFNAVYCLSSSAVFVVQDWTRNLCSYARKGVSLSPTVDRHEPHIAEIAELRALLQEPQHDVVV